jgi:deazaflavin-dependent oxidoreductase (nitroreductase family)
MAHRRGVPQAGAHLLLEHRGRKSGRVFVAPLLYIAEGPNVIIVASQAGRPEDPQWYRNLVATPDTHIETVGIRRLRHV